MTPSIAALRREEQRVLANTWFRRLWPVGLALLTFAWGFVAGIHHRAPEGDQPTQLAIDDTADSLRLSHHRGDSLAHADSVATRIAALAGDSVAAHAPAVHRAAAAVSVSSIVTDSEVRIQRPAAADSVGAVGGAPASIARDTTVVLPLEIATYIRETKPQLARLTLQVADLTAAGQVKDARIAELVHGDSLWQRQDSLHRDREGELEDQSDSAFRRGAVAGVKGTIKILVVAAAAIKLAAVVRH